MNSYGLLIAVAFILAAAVGIYKWYNSEFETLKRDAKSQAISTRKTELKAREEAVAALPPGSYVSARALKAGGDEDGY